MKIPLSVGAQVSVKWHRGEFFAVARNCRQDGADFLLGVRREQRSPKPAPPRETKPTEAPAVGAPVPAIPLAEPALTRSAQDNPRTTMSSLASPPARTVPGVLSSDRVQAAPQRPVREIVSHEERHSMESRSMFPKFWRREQASAAPEKPAAEVPSRPAPPDPPDAAHARADLLSYEDIYRAAGILPALGLRRPQSRGDAA